MWGHLGSANQSKLSRDGRQLQTSRVKRLLAKRTKKATPKTIDNSIEPRDTNDDYESASDDDGGGNDENASRHEW